MNTAAPSSASNPAGHGTAAAGHAHGGHAGARGPGKPGHGTAGTADPFASLMLMLNASNEIAADAPAAALDADAEKPIDGHPVLAQDNAQNPLAGLLGWPGMPLPVLPSTQGATGEPGGTRRLSALADAAADSLKGLNGKGQPADTLSAASTATNSALATGQRADGLPPTTAPETLDADALAALARANATEAPSSATADGARAAAPVRITAWRSTTGLAPQAAGLATAQALAHGATGHASVSQATFAQDSLARTSGADAVALGAQLRSTVQLDDRFALSGSDSGSTSTPAIGNNSGTSEARHAALPGDAGAGGTGNGAGQDAGPELSQGFSATGDDRNASDAVAQAAAEADDSASAGWGAQHLRHASVRVGEPGEQAIDIQLSMAGQEVRVEFRTDDAQTRASLAQDGGASLGELLQRSGIDLGGVSVGAQGQQAGQDPSARSPQGPSAPATHRGREVDAPVASNVQPPRPRADGSRPLDLFV